MDSQGDRAAEALAAIIRELNSLEEAARGRVLNSVLSFFHLSSAGKSQSEAIEPVAGVPKSPRPEFSAENFPSPKEFIAQKQPGTDVERMACLAYYLTHFRETPYFKTLDLAKLNTEAAQPRFSNSAYVAKNATTAGYLVPGPKDQRQISAAGEQFVVALPDRELAKETMMRSRRRKNSRRKK